MRNLEDLSNIWSLYQNAKDYTESMGLSEKIKKCVDFYEGNQWAKPTDNTRSMPRPVINLVKFICRNKRAMLTSTPIRLVYSSTEFPDKAKEFTEFASYITKEMEVDELDSKAARDAVIKGSYFYHLYWDKYKVGKKGIIRGGLRAELIDPTNIFFSNPADSDEQKQEWIIISSYLPIELVKNLADDDVDTELIVPDNSYGETAKEYCTLLTRYFRINGEVFCEKGTKKTIVNKRFKISPLDDNSKYKANLYPIVAGSYEEKEKCIYGISEAEGLISNQKLVNNILGMEALAIQNTAWGKYIVSKDALKGQQITNDPGEILVDHSLSGNGIRRMEEHSLSSMPINYVNNLTSMIRTVSGATEVLTGETLLGNMSGTAIAQLQNQANQPILDQRKRFWRTKQRFGKVLEQCFRLYFDEKEYEYGKEENKSIKVLSLKDFENVDFNVTVEAVGGANGSVTGDISLLEKLYERGDIDALTFIKVYPNDMILDKNKLLSILESKASVQHETAQSSQNPNDLGQNYKETAELLEK